MGGLFGGGTQTVNQTTTIPEYLQEYQKAFLANAQRVTSTPFTPYNGELIAGPSALQRESYAGIQNALGSWRPQMQQGVNDLNSIKANPIAAQNVGNQLQNGDIQKYMNPFTQSVIDPSLALMNQQTQQGLNQIGDQAASAGAFGGSRQGVQEAVLRSQSALQAGQLGAQLQSQSYNTALGAMQTDASNNLNAQIAQQQNMIKAGLGLGTLASQTQQSALGDISALNQLGIQQQQNSQNIDNAQYQQFQNQINWPLQMLQYQSAAASGSPWGGSTSTTQPLTTNYGLLGLGGAAAGASLGLGSAGGMGLGALGALLALSDKRLKKDIEKIGKAATGVDIVEYRMKGESKTAPKTIGVIAQDAEKKAPGSVVTLPSGVKAVNYPAATGGALGLPMKKRA